MNKIKLNDDNSLKYHLCLNAEQCERLKEQLKEHLHDNKLHIHQDFSESLKQRWKQVAKIQLSQSASQEVKDQVAKWILTNENQKKRIYTDYLSASNSLNNLRNATLSFNIAPQNSLKNYYKKINFSESINEALSKDWKNVSEDFYTGFLSVLMEQRAGKSDHKESDEREFGQ